MAPLIPPGPWARQVLSVPSHVEPRARGRACWTDTVSCAVMPGLRVSALAVSSPYSHTYPDLPHAGVHTMLCGSV
eukprot:11925528-Alexandrium_andersonii.AAC.1